MWRVQKGAGVAVVVRGEVLEEAVSVEPLEERLDGAPAKDVHRGGRGCVGAEEAVARDGDASRGVRLEQQVEQVRLVIRNQ